VVVAALVLLALWAIWVAVPWWTVPNASEAELRNVPTESRWQAQDSQRKRRNDARTTLLQGLGGLAVRVGAAAALRQVKIASEGQVTERFTRAVDQLGHESLDVRLGGIYALERITGDSERDRSTIAEILTAFVRGHAPWPPSRPGQPHKDLAVEDIAPLQRWAPDVQAALTVLGRREPAFGPDLDLRHTDLRGANLRRAYLEDAVLEGARLQKANLSHAQLRAAHLENAQLQGALLYGVRMRSASLTGAQLQGASCMTPSCTLPTLTRRSSKARCMTSAQPGQRTSTQARPEPPSTGPRLSCLRPPDQASFPTQAVHHRRTATDNPMPGRSSARFNPAQARGLARSFATISSARSACSLASAARGPP
jgi:Pentapeptide repeats (8 copies)